MKSSLNLNQNQVFFMNNPDRFLSVHTCQNNMKEHLSINWFKSNNFSPKNTYKLKTVELIIICWKCPWNSFLARRLKMLKIITSGEKYQWMKNKIRVSSMNFPLMITKLIDLKRLGVRMKCHWKSISKAKHILINWLNLEILSF